MEFVIMNLDEPGFAWDSPMEGWIFAVCVNHATVFTSEQDARKIVHEFYRSKRVEILPVGIAREQERSSIL